MEKSIFSSLILIKERILRINEIISDKDKILENLSEQYYYDPLKLSLIEIGEESKLLNDYLKNKKGKWDDIISKEYNFRISLTHFYKNMSNFKIDKHIENDFPTFVKKIEELEKEFNQPQYSLISAIADNFVIGNGLKIPWYIPEDFKLFKEKTQNSIIIMGKKTWDSLPIKPLPNRINIVISKQQLNEPRAIITNSLEKAFQIAKNKSEKENKKIFVIGGASIYKQTIKNAKYLYISHVNGEFEGDIFFPKFNKENYKIIEQKNYETFTFCLYEKI